MSKKEETGLTGFTYMKGRHISYSGKWVRGLWHDDNDLLPDIPPEDQTGWGIKFDIVKGYVIRPMAKVQRFWSSKKIIADVKEKDFDEIFGPELAIRVKHVLEITNGYSGKYGVYNPWYGIHTSVERSKTKKRKMFLSITTPWKSFYIGCKSYALDPLENDYSWTDDKIDVERGAAAQEEFGYDTNHYYALCPSGTLRSHR